MWKHDRSTIYCVNSGKPSLYLTYLYVREFENSSSFRGDQIGAMANVHWLSDRIRLARVRANNYRGNGQCVTQNQSDSNTSIVSLFQWLNRCQSSYLCVCVLACYTWRACINQTVISRIHTVIHQNPLSRLLNSFKTNTNSDTNVHLCVKTVRLSWCTSNVHTCECKRMNTDHYSHAHHSWINNNSVSDSFITCIAVLLIKLIITGLQHHKLVTPDKTGLVTFLFSVLSMFTQFTNLHARTHARTRDHVRACACTCIYILTCAYICIGIHIVMHVYTALIRDALWLSHNRHVKYVHNSYWSRSVAVTSRITYLEISSSSLRSFALSYKAQNTNLLMTSAMSYFGFSSDIATALLSLEIASHKAAVCLT
jgi:hypothetical protein